MKEADFQIRINENFPSYLEYYLSRAFFRLCCLTFYFKLQGDNEEQEKLLKKSCTLYVGNLSFYTTEEQIYELFSKSGDIKKIIMGLDKMKKTACGFCFVEYPSYVSDVAAR